MKTKKHTRVRTPHAAIKIWNYVDRIKAEGPAASKPNTVKEEIISTVSCVTIQTAKMKSNPVGTFHLVLAPTRNWTAVITPGSWCVVMMSNQPITEKDFQTANPKLVKMIGRIDTVRTQVSANDDGTRNTAYLVSGQDWAQIFNDNLYIDPLIIDPTSGRYDESGSLYAQLIQAMQRPGTPVMTKVRDNMLTLIGLFGKPLIGISGLINRIDKTTHSQLMPTEMMKFLGFKSPEIISSIKLVSGALQEGVGKYNQDAPDGLGWINPLSLTGNHSLWQVLQDNSNYVLNEMFDDVVWNGDKPEFILFNRIKPFAFRKEPIDQQTVELRSLFKYVPTHLLDEATIISLNAGTNWRDKINFAEIKPEAADYNVFDNWTKQKSQIWDNKNNDVFDREGFRPLILSTKYMPYVTKRTSIVTASVDKSVPVSSPVDALLNGKAQVEGWWQGNSFPLTVQKITGDFKRECWVAEQAASDTQKWFDEAKQAGLHWEINSSYRTMNQQTLLQSDPDAAEPGNSPHQNGRALDIQATSPEGVYLKSDTEAGETVLAALERIGEKYGWSRPLKNSVKHRERWHFQYQNWTPDDKDMTFNLIDNPVRHIDADPEVIVGHVATAPSVSTHTEEMLQPDPESISKWVALLQEWFFDTHRLLNGQITLTGSSEYISVGNNIMFDAGLLGVKANYNGDAFGKKCYILAHVESISNNFQIHPDGARSFKTVIEFVRGIIVDEHKNLVGEGLLDSLSTAMPKTVSMNDMTVVTIADKVKGE